MKTNIHTNLLLTVSMIVLLFGCGKNEDTSVKGVSINPSSVVLKKGNSTQLNAVLTPPDASEKSVTWDIDDENVATINDAGVVTGKAGGAAIVTVTSKDGQHKGTRQVLVVDDNWDNIFADSIRLNHHELNLMIYDEVQMDVTFFPSVSTDTTLKWEIEGYGINIDKTTKMLTTHAVGTIYLKAIAPLGNVKDSCKIIVSKIDVTGIELDEDYYEIEVGDEIQLGYTISPADASKKDVYWFASNDITISLEEGKITGISTGSATVTVRTWDGGFDDTCTINVVNP